MDQVRAFIGPQPSLAIVKFRQGIVEIALRGTAIGVAALIFISAAVLTDHTKAPFGDVANVTDLESERSFTHNTANWIIFTASMSILWETLAIILRFLNLSIVDQYIGFVIIVDIVIRMLFILSWFIGLIVFAVIGTHTWNVNESEYPSVPFGTIKGSSSATAFFSFVALVLHIFLGIWMGIWLFAKWQKYVSQYQRGSNAQDGITDALDPNNQDY